MLPVHVVLHQPAKWPTVINSLAIAVLTHPHQEPINHMLPREVRLNPFWAVRGSLSAERAVSVGGSQQFREVSHIWQQLQPFQPVALVYNRRQRGVDKPEQQGTTE